jgi:tetratricopeptide (TPR) repeat protein
MKIDLELKGLDKYFQQGLDLLNQGKYQEGLDKFKESLNENPQYLPTYKNLAHIYLGLQQPSQLLNTMEEALKFDNKSAWIWYSKGYALKLLNRLDESIADLNQCLNLEPKDCDTLTL